MARSTRDLVSRALLLAECLRSGSLGQDQLLLAAYCGDPAAALVRGGPGQKKRLGAWLAGLEAWGRPVVVRAATAAAREALPRYQHVADSPSPLKSLVVAESWAEKPCPAVAQVSERAAASAARAGTRLLSSAERTSLQGRSPQRELAAARAAVAAAHAASAVTASDPCLEARRAVRAAREAVRSERRVWRAMRKTLIRWALEPLEYRTQP